MCWCVIDCDLLFWLLIVCLLLFCLRVSGVAFASRLDVTWMVVFVCGLVFYVVVF